MLSLRDTLPEGVLDLLGKEMWDTPLKEFEEGQGWLKMRLSEACWKAETFPLNHRWAQWMRHLKDYKWFLSQATWDIAIQECSPEFCETLSHLDDEDAWEISTSYTVLACSEKGDPVSYDCTRRYVRLGLTIY
jgi:hypothetical protein